MDYLTSALSPSMQMTPALLRVLMRSVAMRQIVVGMWSTPRTRIRSTKNTPCCKAPPFRNVTSALTAEVGGRITSSLLCPSTTSLEDWLGFERKSRSTAALDARLRINVSRPT